MQMKYLSLALAAALATTLTACGGGSDNKSNYNKDTLTPVTNPDAGGTTDGGNTGGTTDGGNTNTDGTNDQTEEGKEEGKDEGKEEGKEEGKDEGKKDPKEDPKDNVGTASEGGDKAKESSVVGQQYVRGTTSKFDRVKNPDKDANATVIGYVPLQNKEMTNIVVADYNDNSNLDANGKPAVVKYLLGETPKISVSPTDPRSLQYNNDAQVQASLPKKVTKADAKKYDARQIIKGLGTKYSDLKKEGFSGTQAAVDTVYGEIANQINKAKPKVKVTAAGLYDQDTSSQRLQKLIAYTPINPDSGWEAGIVGVVGTQSGDSVATFDVNGQEQNIITMNANGKKIDAIDTADADTRNKDGNNDTRIYGAKSQYFLDGEAQAMVNALTVVPFGRFLPEQDKLFTGTASPANIKKINNGKGIEDNHDLMAGLLMAELTPVRLDNVQYGRVTGLLEEISEDRLKGKTYLTAELSNKFDYWTTAKTKPEQDKQNQTTDVYFYRGLNQTKLDEMPKEGKYNYVGHALMYGIDNTYAGPSEDGKSNSVAYGGNSAALGNFVQAQYDAGKQTVQGSVYNIWYKQANNKELEDSNPYRLEKVDLVTFNGKVIGNSVEGTADRTYKNGDDKAAYKGSFYGSGYEEMGGSFNSVTEKYGNSEWGGVFGARKITQGNVVAPNNAVE